MKNLKKFDLMRKRNYEDAIFINDCACNEEFEHEKRAFFTEPF